MGVYEKQPFPPPPTLMLLKKSPFARARFSEWILLGTRAPPRAEMERLVPKIAHVNVRRLGPDYTLLIHNSLKPSFLPVLDTLLVSDAKSTNVQSFS